MQGSQNLLDALIELLLEPGSSELGNRILDTFNREMLSKITRRQIDYATAPLIWQLLKSSNPDHKETARQFLRKFTVPIIQTSQRVAYTVCSQDGKYIFHDGCDSCLHVSDLCTGEHITQVSTMGVIHGIVLSADGGRCLVAGRGDDGGFVQSFTWNEAKRQLSKAKSRSFEDSFHTHLVGLLPHQDSDSEKDVSALQADMILVWNEMNNLEGYTSQVDLVVFSPRDDTVPASSRQSNEFRVWDAAKTRTDHRLALCYACSSDGRLLAFACNNGLIRIRDTKLKEESRQLRGHTDDINCLCFSPDSKFLVSGSEDGTVRLWDLTTYTSQGAFVGHEDWVRAVAFSPDGKFIVSGGDDGTVRVWDATACRLLEKFGGHEDWVSSVAFSPDGTRIISGGDDQTIRVWEINVPTRAPALVSPLHIIRRDAY